MGSTFGGIELGKRALQAQQKSLDVTGHNIANANNENYSRQRAIQGATTPYSQPALYNSTGAGQVGTGVEIKQIKRVRDQFIDKKLRYENSSLGEWSIKKENLKEVETVFNELGDGGLVNTLDQFWSSFQELNNNPESMAVREAVVQKSITLTTQFNHINNGLMEFREQLGSEIEGRVTEFNSITERIAQLNNQIKAVESGQSKSANDLMDERDALIDDLSKLADIQVNKDSTNQVNISLNGTSVVQGKYQHDLEFEVISNTETSVDGVSYPAVESYQFKVNGNQTQINSGEIQGLRDVRGKIQDYKMNKVDRLAREIKSQVNNLHSSGYGLKDDTTRNFFTGNDASDLKVRDEIINNPEHIAAAGGSTAFTDNNGDGIRDNAGDGSNALAIADLKDNGTIAATSFNDFWQRQASDLGIDIERAERMESNQEVLIDNLKQKRQEISGVSLDEEMTKMVKFQHGYNAAAKVISKMDQMLNTLVNGILK